MKQTVQVTLLGQHYSLRSDASPEEVQRVAAFVNQKLAEVAGSRTAVNPLDQALLALMNIAGDYLQVHERGGRQQEQETLLRRLLERLDRACPEP